MSSAPATPIRLIYDLVPIPERWYLDDGDLMPVSILNDKRAETLRRVFEARVRREARDATIAVNVALRWDQAHPRVGVDPDVLWVEPSIPKGAKSVLTWKPGHTPPRIAVEVVSEENAEKDYLSGPEKYAASGTSELWVFDPDLLGPDVRNGPHVLQLWERDKLGGFRLAYAGDGPAFSTVLHAWLIAIDGFLRVSDDERGKALWPTADEERDAAKAEAADARARATAAETSARSEREARVAAEVRLRALEAQLDASTAKPSRTRKK